MSDPRTPSRAERERLRALAEQCAADPSEWYSIVGLQNRGARSLKDAYFIAACSPSVVLSLLAALDEGDARA